MIFVRILFASSLLLLALAGPTVADPAADWPQIRGLERDGHSPATGLLEAWPEDGPPLVWRRSIGDGFSGITVAGGRLFTLEADAEKEYAVALEPDSGEEIWRVALGEVFPSEFGNGPRSTPTFDADTGAVFVASARGLFLSLDAATGEKRWEINLLEEFGGGVPRFGYSPSALVVDDKVITEAGGSDGHSFVAFDKRSGELRWTALDGSAGYSSPIVAHFGGVRQIVFFRRAEPQIVSLLPEDGSVYWTHEGLPTVIVMPLIVEPDGLFLSATHDAAGVLLRLTGSGAGEPPQIEEAWRTHLFRNHFNASVAFEGHIYGFDNATLKCFDAQTGEACWAVRGLGKGSLIAADGKLIVLSDRGEAALVEATPEEYRELGRFQALTGKAWTAPTLAGGRLYLRDQDELASFDLTAAASAARRAAVVERPAAAAPEEALELAEILARYEKARGGVERWAAVESLERRGSYVAFSLEESFTLLHRRPGHYRFEYTNLGSPSVNARGPGGVWWIEPSLGVEWARRTTLLPYAGLLHRAAELEPALLGAEAKGHQVELVGSRVLDGRAVYELAVTLEGGDEETWYLDAETFLEAAIDSKVYDYTQTLEPIDQRATFADFRQVDGLVIPHRVEREYLSRHTVMKVEQVEVDAELDETLFRMPLPSGMEILRPLAGEWNLTIELLAAPGTPSVETTSTIRAEFDGALLAESFGFEAFGDRHQVARQWSYDRFKDRFRLTRIDDHTHQLGVLAWIIH